MNSKTLENRVLWPTHIDSNIKIDSRNEGLEKERIIHIIYTSSLKMTYIQLFYDPLEHPTI